MREWETEIRRRLEPFGLRPTREREIVEEVAQHLEDRYRDLLTRGETPDDAAAGAWRELDESHVLGRRIAEIERPAPLQLPPPGPPRRDSWWSAVRQDIRYSARTIRISPVFALMVVFALALSIGPLTAIVSIGNWLLWRPHAGVADPGSLALVWFGQWRDANSVSISSGVSNENLAGLLASARTFTGIAGVQESSSGGSVPGGLPKEAATAAVTANFFDVLGVRLRAGRSFTADDDRGPFGSPVTVVSEGLARSAFGSPEAAVGKSIVLNSRPFSVVGVAPAAFGGISNLGQVEAWLTGATLPYLNHVTKPQPAPRGHSPFYEFVLRAAPGKTFAEVQSELNVLVRRVAAADPEGSSRFLGISARVFPGLGSRPLTRPRLRTMVNTMLAVGVVLLLLGCANVANLLVFRAARREHEIAIRQALGATRARLLQLQMIESWILALAGAAVGLALAVFLKGLIEQLLFPRPPGVDLRVPMDVRVLGITTAAALATGTLSALAPAWLAARSRGLAALGRGTFTWSRAPRLRGSLAVLQLALSLTLLVGALLLVSTLYNLRSVDLGFDPTGIAVARVSLDEHGYDDTRALAYHRDVLSALEAHGDFEAVGLASRIPFGPTSRVPIIPPGGDSRNPLSIGSNGISEAYFPLLSIPLVRGRAFTRDEILTLSHADGSPVIVNETLALRLFGSVEALGRTVRLARTGRNPERELTVVGVVRDSRWRSLTEAPDPFLYQPIGQYDRGPRSATYMIRSALPPQRVGEIANAIAARTASGVPLSLAQPLTTGIDRELNQERLFAWMLSLLAALGFVLASLGLYGLVSQATLERRREFGIRMAIGAGRREIVRLVVHYAVAVSSAGVAIGLLFSYVGTRAVETMLFGISRLDPLVYATAATMLIAVVALACLGPALRAVRVQPIEVLRAE